MPKSGTSWTPTATLPYHCHNPERKAVLKRLRVLGFRVLMFINLVTVVLAFSQTRHEHE